MRVLLPGLPRSYSHERPAQADGATLGEVLRALDLQLPGIRFRVVDEQDALRPRLRVFLNGEQVFDLATPTGQDDELVVVQALSGG